MGIVTSRRAVNRKQSEIMSWLGIGTGALAILVMIAGVMLYFGLLLLVILFEGNF